jgi:four helix bundle protein
LSHGNVTQLGECKTEALEVVGSSPTVPTLSFWNGGLVNRFFSIFLQNIRKNFQNNIKSAHDFKVMNKLQNLASYEKAYNLAIEVTFAIENVKDTYLREQLFRSITSAPANFAEMQGYRSDKYTQGKLRIVLGELTEAEFWLNFYSDKSILPKEICDDFILRIVEIRKMICGLMRYLSERDQIKKKSKIALIKSKF